MPKNDENIEAIDKMAIGLTHASPDASMVQISKQITELGINKHPLSYYRRFKKSDYLQREIGAVKKQHAETLSRIAVPLALASLVKTLKDKTLSPKERLPWVKLALDKEMREDLPVLPGAKLSIGQVQSMQVLIQQGKQTKDE